MLLRQLFFPRFVLQWLTDLRGVLSPGQHLVVHASDDDGLEREQQVGRRCLTLVVGGREGGGRTGKIHRLVAANRPDILFVTFFSTKANRPSGSDLRAAYRSRHLRASGILLLPTTLLRSKLIRYLLSGSRRTQAVSACFVMRLFWRGWP